MRIHVSANQKTCVTVFSIFMPYKNKDELAERQIPAEIHQQGFVLIVRKNILLKNNSSHQLRSICGKFQQINSFR